jgi:hypothetical protein
VTMVVKNPKTGDDFTAFHALEVDQMITV